MLHTSLFAMASRQPCLTACLYPVRHIISLCAFIKNNSHKIHIIPNLICYNSLRGSGVDRSAVPTPQRPLCSYAICLVVPYLVEENPHGFVQKVTTEYPTPSPTTTIIYSVETNGNTRRIVRAMQSIPPTLLLLARLQSIYTSQHGIIAHLIAP